MRRCEVGVNCGCMNEAFQKAREEALKSVETFRLGAAVVHRKNVVATGRNRNANSCGLNSIHAEMDALFKCRGVKKGVAHLVIVRVMRDGESTGLSKPCDACSRALARMGVRRVTYTTGNPDKPLESFNV